MRNLFTILICLLMFHSALAKRWADIAVTQLKPENGYTYTVGGTVLIKLVIKNNGPDDIMAGDSLAIRFINKQGEILVFPDGKIWLGVEAKKIVVSDTMFINAEIATSSLVNVPQNFLSGEVCIDVFPCADSIGDLWSNNMDTVGANNHNCTMLKMVPTSVLQRVAHGSHVKVYPNPAADVVYIDGRGMSINEVHILNSVGAFIGTARMEGNGTYAFKTESLAQGLYFAEIITKDERHVVKFLKE